MGNLFRAAVVYEKYLVLLGFLGPPKNAGPIPASFGSGLRQVQSANLDFLWNFSVLAIVAAQLIDDLFEGMILDEEFVWIDHVSDVDLLTVLDECCVIRIDGVYIVDLSFASLAGRFDRSPS